MKKPFISVIVPTFNRVAFLKQTIESLCRQTAAPDDFEVIVVDNGSTDGTESMIREMQLRAPFHLIFRRMEVNRGPVVSRNAAAEMAQGEILAFTDSDCQATEQWVATGLETFRGDPDLAFLTGPAINTPGERLRFFSIGGNDNRAENPVYPTANVMYRASVFHAVGGFDPKAFLHDAGSSPIECSDADMAWRVKELGYRHRHLENLVIHHAIRHLSPFDWLQHHTRLILIPELVRRHPDFRKTFFWWGPFCLAENVLFYVAIIGLLLTFASPWFLLLTLPFLGRNIFLLSRSASFTKLPIMVVQLGFISIRQAVICGSLIYGSVRARRLVL